MPALVFLPHLPVRERDLAMNQFVGFTGMLLASSAGAWQTGHVAVPGTAATTMGATGLMCETRAHHRPAPELVVTLDPPKVKIPDNSKRGTRLATIAVRWSNGERFGGEVRLTKNPGGICQLSGMVLQLGRDTKKADDYTTPVCTVTAIK